MTRNPEDRYIDAVKTLEIQSHPAVKDVFERYPEPVREKMLRLRRLVLETAEELEGVATLEQRASV